jgi:hypothetical protein
MTEKCAKTETRPKNNLVDRIGNDYDQWIHPLKIYKLPLQSQPTKTDRKCLEAWLRVGYM